MTHPDPDAFAADWIAAWNSHDLDAILSHYADDVVFRSPTAARVVGSGEVSSKAALRDYWQKALTLVPDLHFILEQVFVGHAAVTLVYRRENGPRAAETFEFGDGGLVTRSVACYAAAA